GVFGRETAFPGRHLGVLREDFDAPAMKRIQRAALAVGAVAAGARRDVHSSPNSFRGSLLTNRVSTNSWRRISAFIISAYWWTLMRSGRIPRRARGPEGWHS